MPVPAVAHKKMRGTSNETALADSHILDNELCLHTDYWKASDDYVNWTLLMRYWSAAVRSTAAIQVDTKDKLVKLW